MMFFAPVMTGIVAAPDHALLSAIACAVVALVVGTLVRLALARGENGRPPIRIVKGARKSERDAA
jgi:hypothetical protein